MKTLTKQCQKLSLQKETVTLLTSAFIGAAPLPTDSPTEITSSPICLYTLHYEANADE